MGQADMRILGILRVSDSNLRGAFRNLILVIPLIKNGWNKLKNGFGVYLESINSINIPSSLRF